jgi:peptide/nickel transport system ATP-binding protein
MKQEKNANTLLQIRELVREYILPRQHIFIPPKRFRALDGVSLSLNYGESFGIVGESGCGKSTLARTVLALESPQSGEVCFQGKVLHTLKTKDLRRMRRGMQMVFQDPYGSLDPRHSVSQIVSEPLTLLGEVTLKIQQQQVAEALENVGLSPADANKFPHEFSGGQRQRIAIARALITRPSLIVADEPVSALDVSVQAQVLNLMMDLREQHGLAYLFISHDLSIVRHMTTNVAVMFAGRIVETGPTETLFDHAQHPYTRALLEAVPRPDPSRKRTGRLKKSASTQLFPETEGGCAYAYRCPLVEEKCREKSPSLLNLKNSSAMESDKNPAEIVHKVACYKPLDSVVSV